MGSGGDTERDVPCPTTSRVQWRVLGTLSWMFHDPPPLDGPEGNSGDTKRDVPQETVLWGTVECATMLDDGRGKLLLLEVGSF